MGLNGGVATCRIYIFHLSRFPKILDQSEFVLHLYLVSYWLTVLLVWFPMAAVIVLVLEKRACVPLTACQGDMGNLVFVI
jgi:hypothetical protein